MNVFWKYEGEKEARTITYLKFIFNSYVKSVLGYTLTQSQKRQALERMKQVPSHHHFMYEDKLNRAEKFEKWLQRDTETLQSEMSKAGYRFQEDYDLQDISQLNSDQFIDIIEKI